jgi:hypothetical protein
MLTAVKRWLTFHLVKIASQLDGELFMRLCEVAVYAKHRDAIEAAKEAMQDVIRLEQEHDYDYNHEREEYNGTTKSTTH